MKITSLDALQIFDSRGNPTVEVIATLEDGTTGHGLVPSGASTGHHEALELRDGDKSRFRGKSVFKALSHVKGEIAHAVVGRDVFDQSGLDDALISLDGTPGKSRLGANAILGTSMAVAQAAANARRLPLFESLGGGEGTLLPLPEIQIFGGGKHAQGRIDIQDFMIMALTAKSYDETLEVTANVFHAAADIM
ncbi:MAG: phosphopyruvate hydratase, partial [Prosthecobacter sp.]|nr:phosphopyruvate hydratase [Prosthecobacter sp.]